jgi:urea transport system permease protein
LGAILVNFAKTTFTTGFMAPYWLFALGALFVFTTLFMPKGVIGTWSDWQERRKARPTPNAPQPAE